MLSENFFQAAMNCCNTPRMYRLESDGGNCIVELWLCPINLVLTLCQVPLFVLWFGLMIVYSTIIFALSSVLFVLDILTCGTLGGKSAGFSLKSQSYSSLAWKKHIEIAKAKLKDLSAEPEEVITAEVDVDVMGESSSDEDSEVDEDVDEDILY